MDTLTLMPDIEALVSDFLRDQAEVAALVDDRVYTVLPTKVPGGLAALQNFVRLTLVPTGANPIDAPRWLMESRVQVDVWAKQKKTAKTIAETCAAAACQRIIGQHDEGVVTRVRAEGMGYQPDPDLTDVPTPRYLFDLVLTYHPTPEAPGPTSSS